MPKLPRNTYRLELNDGELNFDVEVNLADVLRAELEGPRHGITDPSTQSLHTTVLWLWAGSLRTGQWSGTFPEFKAALTNFETLKVPAPTEVQGVPPTVEDGQQQRPSSSPADSDTPTPLEDGSTSSSWTPPTPGSE